MVCGTKKSLVAKKLHIYFDFISFQEIFMEHLLPDTMLSSGCANLIRTIPGEMKGSGGRLSWGAWARLPAQVWYKQAGVSCWKPGD